MGSVKILSASAGSGKTYNLSKEYVKLVIENPMLYNQILAVTFTNKATEEMKGRILDQIDSLSKGSDKALLHSIASTTNLSEPLVSKRAKEALSRILHDYNRFSVITIDKFFQRIIRGFLHELNIDTTYTLQLQTDTLIESAADKLIDNLVNDDQLRRWVVEYIGEKIDQTGRWDFRSALAKLGNQLFAEEFRSQFSVESDPQQTRLELSNYMSAMAQKLNRALELSKQAADTFLTTVADYGLEASDFYRNQSGVVGYAQRISNGSTESPNSYVTQALVEDLWYAKKCAKRATIDSIKGRLLSELTAVKERAGEAAKATNSYSLLRSNFRPFALMIDLERCIEAICNEENVVPISKVNDFINSIVNNNDTPFIYEKAGNTYTHFMIDEFQDTSLLQWNNFLPLLHNAIAQQQGSPILLVGDVKQSIYRWRGGDWRILSEKVEKEFNSVSSEKLTRNFRSTPVVVGFNNALIGRCSHIINFQSNKALKEAFEAGRINEAFAKSLEDIVQKAYSDYLQTPNQEERRGYATLTVYNQSNDPHPAIALIEDLQERGYRPSDIAVLVRANDEGELFAKMLLQHKADNPDSPYCFDVITQDALTIGSSDVCEFIVAVIRASIMPDDSINTALLKRLSNRSFSDQIAADEQQFISSLRSVSPEEAFEQIVVYYKLDSAANVSFLQALHEQIITYTGSHIGDLRLFVEWWSQTGRNESIAMPTTADAITIATIHKSKGLGYRAVIIPYCDWELTTKPNTIIWSPLGQNNCPVYPVEYKRNMSDSIFAQSYFNESTMALIDSLNTLYVALTRAKEEIHLMLPRSEKGAISGIGSIVASCVHCDQWRVSIGNSSDDCFIEGETETDSESTFSAAFGTCQRVEQTETQNAVKATRFGTYPIDERVRVKYSIERYVEDNPQSRLHPLGKGIMMHRLFAQALTTDQIVSAAEQAFTDAAMNREEYESIKQTIDKALQNPIVQHWFDGSWSEIRNENDIITPSSTKWRPDRVMMSTDETVVVDYKFGLAVRESHQEQVANYMKLMEQMGYKSVSGYIWYIALDRIVEVTTKTDTI